MNAISPRWSVSPSLSVMARQLMVSSQLMYWGGGGTPCEVSSATQNKHAVGISNISVNTTATLTSIFLKSIPPLVLSLFSFAAFSLSIITSFVSFTASPLPPSWKRKMARVIYIHIGTVCCPSPSPLCFARSKIGLQESSYSITNRPPTRPLTTLTFFYEREEWTGLMFRHK